MSLVHAVAWGMIDVPQNYTDEFGKFLKLLRADLKQLGFYVRRDGYTNRLNEAWLLHRGEKRKRKPFMVGRGSLVECCRAAVATQERHHENAPRAELPRTS